jgi:hypothetical protein
MHLKVFLKLKKTPKNPLVWAKNPKKPKNPINPKKPTGLSFKKKPGFFQPCRYRTYLKVNYTGPAS